MTKFYFSGLFLPGMNAIMGPTGSGKTTLVRSSFCFESLSNVHSSFRIKDNIDADSWKGGRGHFSTFQRSFDRILHSVQVRCTNNLQITPPEVV